MKFIDFIMQFPISIAAGVVAIVIFMFGWLNSYSDPLISFLVFEAFVLVACIIEELQKFRRNKNEELD